MKALDDLGAALEQQWRRANYDEHLFPELAVDALVRADLVERLDPWSIVRWIFTTPSLPAQQDEEGHFSDLPFSSSRARGSTSMPTSCPTSAGCWTSWPRVRPAPIRSSACWPAVQELAGIAVFGSHESNVLGIEGFGEGHVRALRASLRGESQPADAEVVDNLKASVLGVLM